MEEEGLLECSICQHSSDDLRLLSCTHSYCTPCLEAWAGQRQNLSGRRIVCPDCRQVTTLPAGGVTKLAKGISVRVARALIQSRSQSNSEATGSPSSTHNISVCQFCKSDGARVRFRCVQCRRNLCESCAASHCQRAAFRTHQLEAAVMGVLCDVHEESSEYYCYDCSRPMCVLCMQQEDHPHDTVPFQQAYEDCRQKMEAASPDLTPLVVDLKSMQDALVGLDYPLIIAQQHREAREKIKAIVHTAIEDIKEWEQDMLDTMRDSVDANQKAYDVNMEILNTAYATGSTLMAHIEKAECSAILKEGVIIQQRVEDIRQMRDEIMDFVPGTVTFEPTGKKHELDFGELKEAIVKWTKPVQTTSATTSTHPKQDENGRHIYENLTFKPPSTSQMPKKAPPPKPKPTVSKKSPYIVREMEYSTVRVSAAAEYDIEPEAFAIAHGPDQSMIVADVQNGVLFRVSADGTSRIIVPPGTMQPRGLAVAADGNIYTCDAKTKTIWIFDQHGGTVARWTKPELSFPKGIGVLQSGHVVVADRDLCKVFIYDTSGKLQRSFGQKGGRDSHFKCPSFLAVDAMDRILVSDYENKAIKIFTATSEFLRLIPLKWPGLKDAFIYQSICTDSSCNIYIAQKSQAKVVKLDDQGIYMGTCLSAKGACSVEAPCALAMDGAGHLAVSETTKQGRKIIKVIKLF